jgi:hypothetical protein
MSTLGMMPEDSVAVVPMADEHAQVQAIYQAGIDEGSSTV